MTEIGEEAAKVRAAVTEIGEEAAKVNATMTEIGEEEENAEPEAENAPATEVLASVGCRCTETNTTTRYCKYCVCGENTWLTSFDSLEIRGITSAGVFYPGCRKMSTTCVSADSASLLAALRFVFNFIDGFSFKSSGVHPTFNLNHWLQRLRRAWQAQSFGF